VITKKAAPGKTAAISPQLITLLVAVTLIAVIFVYGNTKFYHKKKAAPVATGSVTTEMVLAEARKHLSPADSAHLQHIENEQRASKNDAELLATTDSLLQFWGPRMRNPDAYGAWLYEKAKLEKSEKSLTFAAHFLLNNAIGDDNRRAVRSWKAGMAKELFEKALRLNPNSDSLKIGKGGCYMFGAGGSNPMEGITLVREAVAKDSTNAFAHRMLGLGNIENGQEDKAIERFEKSVQFNPGDENLMMIIALMHKQKGNMAKATAWYERLKKELATADPELFREFDEQFQSLK
jgi:tetratricopeptide (TPR) repeat protein